jgi:hypothetical protein
MQTPLELLVRNLNVDLSRLLSSAGVVEEKEGRKFVRIDPVYDVAGLPLKDLFEFDVEGRRWLGDFPMQSILAATQVDKGFSLLPNTYTVEGRTWVDMDNDHELVWFEESGK